MNDYGFGNFVCMLREKQGLTQAELAGLLGITAAAVNCHLDSGIVHLGFCNGF